jgi:hypothetical protein
VSEGEKTTLCPNCQQDLTGVGVMHDCPNEHRVTRKEAVGFVLTEFLTLLVKNRPALAARALAPDSTLVDKRNCEVLLEVMDHIAIDLKRDLVGLKREGRIIHG